MCGTPESVRPMRSSPDPRRRQGGFTLIEAMTAGVVLSILSLGLMGLWTTAGANVDQLVIREKAIWQLNGQLERLAALYTFTDFGDGGADVSSGYGYDPALADDRLIFGQSLLDRLGGGLLGDLIGTENDFGFVADAGNFDTADGQPVAIVGGLTPANDRNYIWIDRDRGLVGRFSWAALDLAINACGANNQTGGANPCLCFDFAGDGTGGRCLEVTATLEFPLRWDAATDDAVVLLQTTEVLSLRTIVGRR